MPGLRGSLLDRSGTELAASEDAATIYATPYQVKNPPQAAEKLAPILELDEADVLEALTADNGFSYVAHKVSLEQAGADRTARTWKGSASCPTAAAPTRRAKWRGR